MFRRLIIYFVRAHAAWHMLDICQSLCSTMSDEGDSLHQKGGQWMAARFAANKTAGHESVIPSWLKVRHSSGLKAVICPLHCESAIRASDFSHKHHRASFHPALSSRHRTWAFKTANCYFRYNIYIIKYEKKTKQYLLNPKFPFFLSKRLTRRNIERPGNKHQKSDSCSS